ncbi:hypothetical protein [Falsiporphyromonas endometrii]|uniref:Uncharacterized protein n=1 Tax=Falsiporphyromonas endometrii TaxID=1387297 RepID=A0ABV9K8X6_9PORP
MEIIISFTIFLIAMLLGRLCFQVGEICFIGFEQIAISASFKNKLTDSLLKRAVKLIERAFYLLNNVFTYNIQKGAQSNLIYTEFHIFLG